MISVAFRTRAGDVTNRRFPLNTGVSIYGKVTGASGLGSILTGVRLEVPETGHFEDSQTNLFGDYAFWYVTPGTARRMTFKITATYSLSGQESVSIPVIVGELAGVPAELPAPPSTEPITQEVIKGFGTILVVAALVIGTVYLLPYLVPRIKKAFA